MNYCPECGHPVEFVSMQDDMATFHSRFHCSGCTADWEETVEKGVVEKTLHISPVEGGG